MFKLTSETSASTIEVDKSFINLDFSNCIEIDDDIFEKSKLKKDKKIPLWFYKNRIKR